MRFLGVGETNDLGDMYLRLIKQGHEVRVYMSDESSSGVMHGMLDFTPDWRRELDWIRDADADGVILFESASAGDSQDELRSDGFNVIGGGSIGDRLEGDRAYGQEVLRGLGLQTATSRVFQRFDDGLDFLRMMPGRYVFKLNGSNWPSTSTYIGQMDTGADMIAVITMMRDKWTLDERPSFLLMDYVDGVEVGVGAFFNGERFLGPANLDWEHKHLFPGDIGELTGEMGTVVTYRGAERMFDATLSRMAPLLKESGYCGYINLNTIVNDGGVWPLEFTCRFGYPGFPILDSLHEEHWDSIFAAMLARERTTVRTKSGFSVGVVLTVPPFPYPDGYSDLGKGAPICFRRTMTEADHDSLHYGEVSRHDGRLVTAGMVGYVMVVTGIGDTVESARVGAYDRVGKVVIPNMRYRDDIGLRFIARDRAEMQRLGWLG